MNKNLKIMLAIGTLLLVMAMFEPAFATDISSCQNITSSGTYNLVNDLSGNQSDGHCINIQASDVILDCQNHKIVGNWSYASIDQFETSGIYSNSALDNVTIKNCYATNYSTGVYIKTSISNLTLTNNTLYHNWGRVAYISASNNTIITNNRFINITDTSSDLFYMRYAKAGSIISRNNFSEVPGGSQKGIYMYYDNNVLVSNNNFSKIGDSLITYHNVNDNIINNTFNLIGYKAIGTMYDSDDIISNNTIYGGNTTTEYGITTTSDVRSIIENNYLEGIKYTGIYLTGGGYKTTIRNNVVNLTWDYQGIDVYDSGYTYVYNNTIIDAGSGVSWSTVGAINGRGAHYNEIHDNRIYWDSRAHYINKKYGIRFVVTKSAYNNTFYNNWINNSDIAVYIANGTNNLFENNTILNSQKYGIFFKVVDNSSVYGRNKIISNGKDAVYINISNNNIICNNTIYYSNQSGINLSMLSFYNNISGNNISLNNYGIYLNRYNITDYFSKTSIDGNTELWTPTYESTITPYSNNPVQPLYGSTGGEADINVTTPGMAHISLTNVTTETIYYLSSDFKLGVDGSNFNVTVDFNNLDIPDVDYGAIALIISSSKTSTTDEFSIARMYDSDLDGQVYYAGSPDNSYHTISSSDTSGKFRITRTYIGDNRYEFELYYWNHSTNLWYLLHDSIVNASSDSWARGSYYVHLEAYSSGNYPNVSGDFDNFYAVTEDGSSHNLIYNNYFDNNISNVYAQYSSPTNKWNTTKTLGTNIIGGPYIAGNYWDDYNGEDYTNDGLGDILLPYNSNGNISSGGDYAPLTAVSNCLNLSGYNEVKITKNATICPGTYYMNDTDKDGVIIMGNNSITLDCNDSIIIGDQTDNSIGINVSNTANVTINNCTIKGYGYGVYSHNTTNLLLTDFNITNNSKEGVYSFDNNNFSIYNSSVNNNGDSPDIYYVLSHNGTIQNITASNLDSGRGYGLWLDRCNGTMVINFSNYKGYGILLDSNNINLKDVYVSNSGIGIAVDGGVNITINRAQVVNSSEEGIYLEAGVRNSLISNSKLWNNKFGIGSSGSLFRNTRIVNNTIYNNIWGIYAWDSRSSVFENNTITNSTIGIYASLGYGNNFTGNHIEYNTLSGINLTASTHNNIIYNNYFANNSINAYSSNETNRWNISKTLGTNIIGGPYIAGNYWDDYTGIDKTNDGLGDTLIPYNSGGHILNGGDYTPLTTVSGMGSVSGEGSTTTSPAYIIVSPDEINLTILPGYCDTKIINLTLYNINKSKLQITTSSTMYPFMDKINGTNITIHNGTNQYPIEACINKGIPIGKYVSGFITIDSDLPSTHIVSVNIYVNGNIINCSQVENYVCGVDGQTYLNNCSLAAHNVSWLKDGKCDEISENVKSLETKTIGLMSLIKLNLGLSLTKKNIEYAILLLIVGAIAYGSLREVD